MRHNLTDGIVCILGQDHQAAGTGFVVNDDGLIATCAHVIQSAGAMPGDVVDLILYVTGEQRQATVEWEYWRNREAEDIAILRLQGSLPKLVVPLPLGSSAQMSGHLFRTFGFPSINPIEGMWGGGEVLGHKLQGSFSVLQLRSEEVTQGFSGAPIWDDSAQIVIGMVNSSTTNREVKVGSQSFTTPFDSNWRFLFTAFASPTETLRESCPVLQVSNECPYRQLVAFSETDAPLFFGREAFVKRLIEHLHEDPHFLAIFGPSGSGKSSVMQAGLIPQLREGAILGSQQWEIIVTRPSDDPFQLLAQTRRGNSSDLRARIQFWLTQHPKRTDRVVLVIDQFEEALVAEESIKNSFITQLTGLLNTSQRITLIIIMRDDFYSQFVGQEALRRKLDESKGAVNVPQILTREDMKAIICEPARHAHVHIQEGLVDLIIRDAMEGKVEARSTILPLLEFTLTRLWEKRQQEILTLEAYEHMHGIAGEFTSWANITYDQLVEELPLIQRHLVQRIFTDLVHLGDESQQQPNSRQRKPLAMLYRNESEFQSVKNIVQQLIQARLLVKNEEMIEIMHDVLLNEWGYLKSWIKDNRGYLEWHQRLKEKIQEWEKTNQEHPKKRDEHKLLAGSDLMQAISHLKRNKGDLSTQEQFFIHTSEKRRRKEANTWRAFILVLMALVLLAGGLASWALLSLQQVQAEKRVAVAHALVAQANTYLLKQQFDLALLLSIKAYQIDNDYDTRDGLLTALESSSRVDKILHDNNLPSPPSQNSMIGLAFSVDGRTLISAREDGRVVLWNTITGAQRSMHIPTDEFGYMDMTLSPYGNIVATSGSDGLWLWDTQIGKRLIRLSDPLVNREVGESAPFTFSPDEHILAVQDGKGGLVLWDTASRKPLGTLVTGLADSAIGHMAFSADDKLLAVSVCEYGSALFANGGNPIYCGRSEILLWNVASRTRIGVPFRSNQFGVRSIALSPNGHILATGGTDNTIVLWDTTTQQPLGTPLQGHTNWVESLSFSPNGKLLASGSDDNTVILWNVAARKEVGEPFLGHKANVSAVTFSTDGRYLASSSADNTIIIWNVLSNSHLSQPLNVVVGGDRAGLSSGPFVDSFAYSEDSGIYLSNVKTGTRTILLKPSSQTDAENFALSSNLRTIAAYGTDGTITIWDMMTRKLIWHFKNASLQNGHDIALSSDGKILAACCDTNQKIITAWDVATGHVIRRIVSHDEIYTIAISPDGSMIASGGAGKIITLWNVATGTSQSLSTRTSDIFALAFSPDGRILASRTQDGTLLLWDTTNLQSIDPPPINNDPVVPTQGMAFSPDGNVLAVASGPEGTSITLWDLKKHEMVAHTLSSSPITDLIFGLQGQLLATTNIGHGVVFLSFTLWDSNVDSWVDRACSIANRNLTMAEWKQFVGTEPYSKECTKFLP